MTTFKANIKHTPGDSIAAIVYVEDCATGITILSGEFDEYHVANAHELAEQINALPALIEFARIEKSGIHNLRYETLRAASDGAKAAIAAIDAAGGAA